MKEPKMNVLLPRSRFLEDRMQNKNTISSKLCLSTTSVSLPLNFGVQTSQRDQNRDRPVIGQEDTQPTLVYPTSVPANWENIVILHIIEQDGQDGKQPFRSILDELIRDVIKTRGLVVPK